MAYTLRNMCAKNCCKQTILVQLIKNVVTFFETHCKVCNKRGGNINFPALCNNNQQPTSED